MAGPVQARVANGVSGNPFTYRADSKAPSNAQSRPENWSKLPVDNVYRKEWDAFARDLKVNGQDRSARPIILKAIGVYFDKVTAAANRNVDVAPSARVQAVREVRAEIKAQVKAQEPSWTERLTNSLSALDPFAGVETLAANGLHALSDNPAIANTLWGQALGRVATGVGTLGAFNDGVRQGAWEGGKSLVTGIVTMAGKALQYGADSTFLGSAGDALRGITGKMPGWLNATIPSSQRGQASDAAIQKAGANVAHYLSTRSSSEVANDIGNAINKSWGSLKADHAKAAAQGPEAEARWLGQVTGRITFEIAATFVPVAGVAGKLSKAGKIADAGADALRAADTVGDGARVVSKAPLVGDALRAEALSTVGRSLAVARAVRAMSPAAAREFLLGIDNFAARENILRTIVSDPTLLNVATKADTAVFYSGRITLEKAVLTARQWAESLGGKTILEHTSGGRWLDNVNIYKQVVSDTAADEMWTTLSRRYADGVSGQVVVVKGGMRPDAVLYEELKVLEAAQKSGKISDLKIIELQDVIDRLGK
jgi:hypothetical protein